MTPADLERLRPVLVGRERTVWHRGRVDDQVDELAAWIRRRGRAPSLNGNLPESALALRHHAYACILAKIDATTPPPDPLPAWQAACRRRRAKVRVAAPLAPPPEFWDVSQDLWPDGAA